MKTLEELTIKYDVDALDCFLRTNIDHLYFRDYGILVSKIKEK